MLDTIEQPTGELLADAEVQGDVVSMNELLDEPLTLLLNDRPVARGELLAIDDHFGVRILELA